MAVPVGFTSNTPLRAADLNANFDDLETRLAAVETNFVPIAGTIQAFDLPTCPAGWIQFTAANGRAIVGTNPSTANGLSVRALGATFGAESHVLTVAEMPSHNHTPPAASGAKVLGYNAAGTYGVSSSFPSVNERVSNNDGNAVMPNAGGGEAHNNMQPSLALLICKKT
jgi:hypothetical protein